MACFVPLTVRQSYNLKSSAYFLHQTEGVRSSHLLNPGQESSSYAKEEQRFEVESPENKFTCVSSLAHLVPLKVLLNLVSKVLFQP